MDYFGKPESPWQAAGWVLVAAFVIFALIVDKVASTVYAIFFFAGLWLLIRGGYERPDPLMKWVLVAFAAYFLVGVLSFFLGEEQTRLGEKILGRDIRFLAAVVVSFALITVRPRERALLCFFSIAGIAVGIAAIFEVLLAQKAGQRASGSTIPIVFGHASAAMVGMLLSVFLLYCRKNKLDLLLLGGILFAFLAVLLSGTRGALLSTVLVGFALFVWMAANSRSRKPIVGVLVALLIIAVIVASFGGRITHRFTKIFNEVENHFSHAQIQQNFDWPPLPGCFNQRGFLQWIADNSVLSGEGRLVITVDPVDNEEWQDGTLTCQGGYALTIANPDDARGWVFLPPRSVPPRSTDQNVLMVRGRGTLSLAGTPREDRTRVNTAQVRMLTIDGALSKSANTQVLVALRPGELVQLVPVLTAPGEYSFVNLTTSFGSRLFMWSIAEDVFVQNCFFGRGVGAYPLAVRERAAAGDAPWQLVRFDHAHNEILNTAAERGILGLIALFGVYAAPLWLFYRRRDVFGVAGMAFVGSIFISGLTETIFNHSLGITYYSVFVLLLATASREPLPPSITSQKD